MVNFKTGEFDFHSGRGVGLIISDLLTQSKKRIWICSPWISEKYAEYLLKKKQDGVDVKLITTNDYGINARALKKIIVPKEVKYDSQNKQKKQLTYIVLALSVLFLLSGSPLFLIFLAIGMVLLFYEKKQTVPELLLDVVVLDKNKRLTHSKIYILDDTAIVGSPNFTESGLNHNFETIFSFNKKTLVDKVAKTFEEINHNPEVDYVPSGFVFGELYTPKSR